MNKICVKWIGGEPNQTSKQVGSGLSLITVDSDQ